MSIDIWFEKEIKDLIKIVASTNTTKDVELLFERILTPREINDMARRLKILEMLNAGYSYSMIQQEVKVSSTIIARLSNHIGYGFRRNPSRNTRKNIDNIKDVIINYSKSHKVKYKGIPGIIPISKR